MGSIGSAYMANRPTAPINAAIKIRTVTTSGVTKLIHSGFFAMLHLTAATFNTIRTRYVMMSVGKITITILMPCLNEVKTLKACIERARVFLDANGYPGEILIADNGSSDHSVSIAENCGARVVRVREKGYGNALLGGIETARGDFIIMGDADGSYDFRNCTDLWMNCTRERTL